MRNSLRKVVGGGLLFVTSVLACSSRDTPEEKKGVAQENLTASEITRILSFEGTIGTSGDWAPTGGTVVSSTAHASAGTHSMVMTGSSSISVQSVALSVLGTVGANLSADIWLPTTLNGQSNKGNIQAFFNSNTLQLFSYSTSNIQLTSLTPGQFSRINIPLDSTLKSKLSQSGYTDLQVKLAFSLADTTNQTFVDNLSFNVSTGGSGGASGTGGSKSNGGSSGSGGTKGSGGATATGGGPATGGKSSTGGSSNTGGSNATGGKSSTGGTLATGGSKQTGGTTFLAGTGGTLGTGGLQGQGGIIVIQTGGTPGTGGSIATGGASPTGGSAATGGANTGGSTSSAGSSSQAGSSGITNTGGSAGTTGTTPGLYTFSFQLPPGVNRNQVVFATTGGDLWIDDGVQVVNGSGYSSVSAVGGGKVNRIGVGAHVQNVWSGGDVTLANYAEVHGSLTTAGTVSPQAGAKVDGTTSQQANLGPLQTISWSVTFPPITDPAVAITSTQTYAPGGYPEVDVKTGAQLSLSKGTYTFNNMFVEPGSTLAIDNSQGPVFIYLKDGFTFRGTVTTTSAQPNVLFGVAGTSQVVIDSAFRGIVVAPAAPINLATTTTGHAGAFFGQSITAHQNTKIQIQALQPLNFCGPADACSSFCACLAGSYPCNGSTLNCDTGLTCDSSTDKCSCQSNCSQKQCGDEPYDNCGGLCTGFCNDGQIGCNLTSDCPAGSDCFIGGGPRRGFAVGTNICMPRMCHDQGSPVAQCGTGTQCAPDCAGRVCGDDGCGGQCGTVPPTQGSTHYTCVDGQIAAFDAASINDPGFPGPLPVDYSLGDVGAMPGTFNVSSRGTAQYTIPIEVPPGRQGLQPHLTISHTGTTSNGILGQRWALTGLSRIERCPKTVAQDQFAAPVTLSVSDAFCLDGQRLIYDPGNPNLGMPKHTYHSEIESFQLIEPFGGDLSNGTYVGPKGFTVWTKDGLVLTYGALVTNATTSWDAVVTTNGVRRIWNLKRVQDRAGNVMGVQYSRHLDYAGSTVVETYPEQIVYGGHGIPGADPKAIGPDRVVQFNYSDRPDLRLHFVAGFLTRLTQRLKSIQTYAAGTLVREYDLTYNDGGYHESRISAVTECGPGGWGTEPYCLPPTTFLYNEQQTWQSNVFPPSSPYSSILTVMDVNGDGQDDVVLDGVIRISHCTPGSIKSCTFEEITDSSCGSARRSSLVLDINGDGMDDCIPANLPKFILSNGRGFDSPSTIPSLLDSIGGIYATRVADIDGDGYKDVIFCQDRDPSKGFSDSRSQIEIHRGNGKGFDSAGPLIPMPGIMLCTWLWSMDRDGDGAEELFTSSGDASYVLTGIKGGTVGDPTWVDAGFDVEPASNGTFGCKSGNTTCTFPGTAAAQGSAYLAANPGVKQVDVNGDGLKDIIGVNWRSFNDVSNQVVLWLNTGTHFVASSVTLPSDVGAYLLSSVPRADYVTEPSHDGFLGTGLRLFSSTVAMDYDNDGRQDLVVPGKGGMLRGTSFGTLEWVKIDGLTADSANIVTAADLDGDGNQDLVLATYSEIANGNIPIKIISSDAVRKGILTRIVDGLGKTTFVAYQPFNPQAQVATYSPVSDPASPFVSEPLGSNVQIIRRVAPLVSGYDEGEYYRAKGTPDNWFNFQGNTHHSLLYFEATVGLGGLGWFGFDSITDETHSPTALISTTSTAYHHADYTRAGRVREVLTSSAPIAAGLYHPNYTKNTLIKNSWHARIGSDFSNRPQVHLDSSTEVAYENRSGSGLGDQLYTKTTAYAYDTYGNAKSQTTSVAIANVLRDVTATNATYYLPQAFDSWVANNPNLVSITHAYGGESRNRTTGYDYYSNGLPFHIYREPDRVGSSISQTTTFVRTEAHAWNVDHVEVSDGQETRGLDITYDGRYLWPNVYTNAEGHQTNVRYDEGTGQLATSMDPNGVVNQIQFDPFGRIHTQVSPTEITTYSYSAGSYGSVAVPGVNILGSAIIVERDTYGRGQATSEGYSEQRMVRQQFDAYGREVQRVTSGLGSTVLYEEFERDWKGRVTLQSVPHVSSSLSQGTYRYDYDVLDRVLKIAAPDGRESTADYFSTRTASTTATAAFAGLGDNALYAVASLGPGKQANVTVLSNRNAPLKVLQWDRTAAELPQALADPASPSTMYAYEPFDQLVRATDPDGEITQMGYDDIGRKTSVSSPSTGAKAFAYDGFDEVVREVDGLGTKCYEYDTLGRPKYLRRDALGECDGTGEVISKLGYDTGVYALGKLTYAFRQDHPGSVSGTEQTYDYNETLEDGTIVGRLKASSLTVPGAPNLTTSVDYYGPWLSQIHYPSADGSGFSVFYNYDRIGVPTSVYDARLSNAANKQGLYWKITAFEDGQRIANEQFGNSVTNSYGYFIPGASTPECQSGSSVYSCMPGALKSETMHGPGMVWAYRDRNYSYDTEGNLRDRRDQLFDVPASSQSYKYDAFGRLLEQDFKDANNQLTNYTTWTYTPGGDMQTHTDLDAPGDIAQQLNYEYDSSYRHQLRRVGDRQFSYGGNGNQVTRTLPEIAGGLQTIVYNDFNMPWKITGNTKDSTDTTLEYDAMHQRVAKRGHDKTTIYAGDLYECEGTTPTTGTLACNKQRFKIYGGGKLVAVVTRDTFDNDDLKFVHADRLGSSSLVTDKDGYQVESREFEAFGAPQGSVDFTSTGINSGFTGQEHDAELGLINMGGRLYDPTVGRFITADPYVTRPFDPQGLNRYSYVQDNPLNAVDPSGFSECSGSDCGGSTGVPPSYTGGGGSSSSSGAGSSSSASSQSSAPSTPSASQSADYGGAQISGAQQQQFNQSVAIAGQKAQASMSTSPACFTDSSGKGSPQGGAGLAGPGSYSGAPPGYNGYSSAGGPTNGAIADASSNPSGANPPGGVSWSPGSAGTFTPAAAGGAVSAGGAGGYQGSNGAGQPIPGVHQVSALESVVYGAPIVILAPEVLAGLLGGGTATGVGWGIRMIGGGISGGLSPAISGKSGGAIAQGMIIGATFSGLNLFGSSGVLSGAFAIQSAAWRGGANSLLTNAANQITGFALNGTSVSVTSLGFSLAGGALFGGVYGNVDVGQLGIPVLGTVIQQTGRGLGMGLISGAIQVGVNF